MIFTYLVNAESGGTYFKTAQAIDTGDTLHVFLNGTSMGYYTVDTLNPDGNIAELSKISDAPAGNVVTAVITG